MIAERPGVGQSAELRQRIVAYLAERGPRTSSQLWVALSRTGTFSRPLLHLQLDLLRRERILEREGRGGAGDPYRWSVT